MMRRILTLAGILALVLPVSAGDPAVLNIGLVDSLVKDLSPGRKKFVESEFANMVKEFTGYKSTIHQGGDPVAAAKKLADGQWHFAVLQGVELAWAQSKDPKIQPLMTAIYKQPTIYAQVLTTKENKAAGFADLKGKTVFLLSKEHTKLFTDKHSGKANDFFAKVLTTTNPEEALDGVLLKKAEAAIVDNVASEIYKEINPGRYNRMKIMAQSEPFPAPVLAYRQGSLSDKVLQNFREGMLKANKSEKGREVMADFHISSFENVPSDYAQKLAAILKAYPPQ